MTAISDALTKPPPPSTTTDSNNTLTTAGITPSSRTQNAGSDGALTAESCCIVDLDDLDNASTTTASLTPASASPTCSTTEDDAGDSSSGQIAQQLDWVKVLAPSELPEPRSGHTAVAALDKMFIFVGYSNRQWFNDLWELDLKTWIWTKIDVPEPRPCERLAHSMSINNNTNKFYVFGGWDETDRQLNDFWEYDIESRRWREILPKPSDTTTPAVCGAPPPRFRHISAFYQRRQRLIVFGGYNWILHTMLSDMYEFDVETETWRRIDTQQQQLLKELQSRGIDPANYVICPRERHAAAIDQENGKLYIMGGYGGFNTATSSNRKFLNDLWEFDLERYSWRLISCTGDIPRSARSHTVVMDANNRRLLVFGGRCGDDRDTNDSYECNLETFHWKKFDNGNNAPGIRGRHTAIMSSGDFVIFGGTHNRVWFNDTYICSFGSYRKDLASLWDEG